MSEGTSFLESLQGGGRIMRKSAVLMVLIVTALPTVRAQAPVSRLEVGDRPSCPGCTIELRKVVTLGAAGDSVSPDMFATVARDSKGNFYVGPVDTPGAVLVYSANGKVIGSVGRQGQGPGEHVHVSIVKVGAGDTLYVLDGGLFRLNVYSPERRLIRIVQLPRRTPIADFLPLPNGDVVFSATMRTAEGIGYPLHVVSPRGEVRRSFGAVNPRVHPTERVLPRVMGAHDSKSVWLAQPNAYELEHWTLDGAPQRVLSRRAAWFAPYAPELTNENVQVVPPRPRVRGILQSSDSVVWIRLDVADAKWRKTSNAAPTSEAGITSIDDYLNYYDGILEAVNPKTGQLIASKRLDTPLQRLFGADLTFTHRSDVDGYRYVDVWQFRLVAPNGAAR
jgi:hypothetical protein